jgi:hypothetical protein
MIIMINLENPVDYASIGEVFATDLVQHRREQDETCINFCSHGDVIGAFRL